MSTIEPQLYIAGDNAFNNEVLAEYLSRQMNLPCRSIRIFQLPNLLDPEFERTEILFFDCTSMDVQKLLKEYGFKRFLKLRRCKVICFNLNPGSGMDMIALKLGIDGVIFEHQQVSLYAEAATAVMNDELWYPRRILEQHLYENATPAYVSDPEESLLTGREKEVLVLLASGMKNSDIAAEFCISPHTVKSHIYNLYKKINVSNRFEAAEWLSENRCS
jgi:LuxR family transcriptional regulator of csgAB operon